MYCTVDIHLLEYLLYDTHESVPTQQREHMVVDPVNSIPEAVITAVLAPDDGCQHLKRVALPTEMQ